MSKKEDIVVNIGEDTMTIEATINGKTFVTQFNKDDKNLMVVKVRIGDEEVIGVARDLNGDGQLEAHETRLDDEYYDEFEIEQVIEEWCNKLGLRAMTFGDCIRLGEIEDEEESENIVH